MKEINVNVIFDKCADEYELYKLFEDDKAFAKRYLTRFAVLNEVIDELGLADDFRKFMAERNRDL